MSAIRIPQWEDNTVLFERFIEDARKEAQKPHERLEPIRYHWEGDFFMISGPHKQELAYLIYDQVEIDYFIFAISEFNTTYCPEEVAWLSSVAPSPPQNLTSPEKSSA